MLVMTSEHEYDMDLSSSAGGAPTC